MRKRFIAAGAASLGIILAMAPAWSADQAGSAAAPKSGAWHFDVAAMDRSVNPGDSFFRFANGGWEKSTEIPADRPLYSSFAVLQDLTDGQVRAILEEAAAAKAAKGSVRQKVGDYYASFMDADAIEARGLAPLKADLAEIHALVGRADLARLLGKAQWNNVAGPVMTRVNIDIRDNSRSVVYVGQSGLGLPNRDFYHDAGNVRFAEIRAKYQRHIANMFRLAGLPDAEERARRVYDLESRIAAAHWTAVELRQVEKTYNPMSPAELAAAAPGMDWPAFLKAAGVSGQGRLIVNQPSALAGAAKLVGSEPIETWKDYLVFRTLSRHAGVLPKAFVAEDFDFYGKTLSGVPMLQERWKRGLAEVNGALGEAVGQLYVARHFPPEYKAKADRLVKNLIAAMDMRLANLEWMAPETKVKARAKLAAFRPKIGYPDKWRDYSAVDVVRGDAFGNLRRAARFDYKRRLDMLGQPVDRGEWFMTPQTVNAYAITSRNEIVFPAAHLQPPFFDPNADDAVNYGGIGIGIGHEISHHFDDQGRKFDPRGNLSDWWTAADVERFKTITDRLAAQYSEYEPLPGQHVDGRLTLGENIADLAGLAIAYDAYKIALGGKPAPVIEGFTGDQRFFLGFAQVWRGKFRDSFLQQFLKTNTHTPAHLRSNTVRNFDPWYAAFDVRSGALYLPPEQRIRIW